MYFVSIKYRKLLENTKLHDKTLTLQLLQGFLFLAIDFNLSICKINAEKVLG